MTSFNLGRLLKALSPETVTLRVRASAHERRRGVRGRCRNAVQSVAPSEVFRLVPCSCNICSSLAVWFFELHV